MEALVKNWKEVAEEIEFMEMVLRGLAPSQYCNSVSTFSTTATDDQDSDISSETSNESAQSLIGEKVKETSRKGANCAKSGDVHQLHEGEIIVYYEVENIKEAVIMEEREDIEAMNEVEIEPVGMINFQRRRMVRPNCNSNITTLSTNTAATTEYDSDASSDDSLNDEKVNGKSTKCHFSPENGEEAAEVYLETLYQKQESHEFLCPNCRNCISKVLIIGERYLGPTPNFSLPKPDELIRCTFCFSFLILAGNWLVTRFAPRNQVGQDTLLTTHPGLNSAPVDIVIHQPHGEKIFYSGVKYSGVQESAVKNYEHKDNIENDDLDSFSPLSHKIDQDQNGSYSEKGRTSEHGIVDLEIKTAEEATEIILENLYQKQESHEFSTEIILENLYQKQKSHEFYCPCCKTCITKVLIIHEKYNYAQPIPAEKEELRCTSAFSFLIPAGNWLLTSSSPNNPTGQVPITVTPPSKSNPSNSANITRLEEQFGPGCASDSMGNGLSDTLINPIFQDPYAKDWSSNSFLNGQLSEVNMLLKAVRNKMLRLLHLKNKTGRVRNHYSVSTTTNAQTLYASEDVRTDQREMDKYTKLNRMFRRKTKKNRKPVVDQKKTSKVFDTDSLCKDLEASKLRAVDVVLSTHLELEAPNFDHIQMNACFLEQQLMAKREYLTKLLAEVDRQIEDMTDSPGAEDRALETD